jgi:hypothetical protein
MPTEFVAQNGAVLDQTTKIAVTGCPKAKKAGHKRKKTSRGKGRANGRRAPEKSNRAAGARGGGGR